MKHAQSAYVATAVLSGRQWLELLAVAALGAAASMWVTGFLFGVDNNGFHLPLVGSLFDEPQFSSDTFMQSLRYYSSGVWLVLRGSARYIDPKCLFLALLCLSRWLSFVGCLLCGSLLGVRGVRQYAVFAGFLCFTVLLQGASAAGDGGMFISVFAHSEIANGTILIALYHAIRARIDLTLVFVGLTAFVNVFMAAWLLIPLTALAVYYLLCGKLEPRQLLKPTLRGAAVLVVLTLPVLYNILSNPDFGHPLDFDYAGYLAFVYPYHFLPWFILPREYEELAIVALLGAIALFELGSTARPFVIVLLGMIATYLIGIVVPFATSSPLVLNLHLLRSGVLFYLMAAPACAALVTTWLYGDDRAAARVFAPVLGATLCATKAYAPWAIVVILVRRLWVALDWSLPVPRLDWVVVAILAVAFWPSQIAGNWRDNSSEARYVAEMTTIGDWVSLHTPSSAIILMPCELWHKHSGVHPPPDVLEERQIADAQGAFVYHARRRLRGSFTEGTAVMWSPSFYHEWRSDIDATLPLRGIAQKVDYSRKHGIDFVLASCGEPDAARYTPVFKTERICLFSAQ